MAEIERTASAVWEGDLRSGNGRMSTPTSGVLKDAAFSFVTRFENKPGTNPEELIAAAHAGCFGMQLSGLLGKEGYQPEELQTSATVEMERRGAGFAVVGVRLEVEGQVPNIDEQTFKRIAEDAKNTCPVSKLLTPGLERMTVDARLKK